MKGILFKEEMFKAVIEGRKTQTRRTVKGLALDWLDNAGFSPEFISDPDNHLARYNVGEVVYLKEPYVTINVGSYLYKYDGVNEVLERNLSCLGGWHNKLFMPERAARYFIKITRVRCERLQGITDQNAIAEGLRKSADFLGGEYGGVEPHKVKGQYRWYQNATEAYKNLWESINGIGSWDQNPWVWVYEFKLTTKPL